MAGELEKEGGSGDDPASLMAAGSSLSYGSLSFRLRVEEHRIFSYELGTAAFDVCPGIPSDLYHRFLGEGKGESPLCLSGRGGGDSGVRLFQYANAAGMAADMEAQSWVDPERFPLLRRRMYSTLENPNLFGAYLLMVISILTAFTLREKAVKRKTVFGVILFLSFSAWPLPIPGAPG